MPRHSSLEAITAVTTDMRDVLRHMSASDIALLGDDGAYAGPALYENVRILQDL
jgi:hypothetical protein